MPARQQMPELVCPAGSLPALKAAVDNGADTVYFGLKNDTNARNFAGLNFDDHTARIGIRYARDRGRKTLLAINTYAQGGDISRWQRAVDQAAELGVDAVILADLGLLAYARRRHPQLRLHLSVQGSATNHEALKLAHELFGIQRAVLPRVLTLDQVRQVIEHSPVEIEVFGFGSLCVMVEGRCLLSSYATGESPNSHGVCSPAKHVQWQQGATHLDARLSGILIDQYANDQPAGYPTLCKGRFEVGGDTYYALEEPTSLNVISMLPQLLDIGVAAIKVEGRQRSPAYVAQVTRVLRQALDAAGRERQRFTVQPDWQQALGKVAEGRQQTLGAYNRPWK
ncbi:ubiquinone anaerobic biosynthesis protein UbiU [Chromobacterium alticapitis]|uniref:Ubiquinone biosynthesis protein UbiU n=1 Tax=Chromobacterium alticapitis TaxID=2073169 RepID=A0A2S5DDI7_9NEIS|nr:peptidase U32 family protein [Chromobacterium alticapitis]POZ61071.1 protease [Chromobacterium alticapitis]